MSKQQLIHKLLEEQSKDSIMFFHIADDCFLYGYSIIFCSKEVFEEFIWFQAPAGEISEKKIILDNGGQRVVIDRENKIVEIYSISYSREEGKEIFKENVILVSRKTFESLGIE